MSVQLDEINKFFKNYEFPDGTIELNQCETVMNLEKFVKSHLGIINANKDTDNATKKTLRPYWERLVYVYKVLKVMK